MTNEQKFERMYQTAVSELAAVSDALGVLHLPHGCACAGVEIGAHSNTVELPTPDHMLALGSIGCYTFRATTCVDRCIAPLVQALWSAGVVTTGCCCGHNAQPGYVGIWTPGTVKDYLTVERSGAVPADLCERICAAIRATDDKSVAEADYMLDANDCIRIVREQFAAAPEPQPAIEHFPGGDIGIGSHPNTARYAAENPSPHHGGEPAAEVYGWAVLDKNGCANRVVSRLAYEYGTVEPMVRDGVPTGLLPYLDREYSGVAPHRVVTLYTGAAPVSAPADAREGDALDARRYRLLRRGQHWSVINGAGETLRAEALDAAADAVLDRIFGLGGSASVADAREGVSMSQCAQCAEFYPRHPVPHNYCMACCRADSDRLDHINSEYLTLQPFNVRMLLGEPETGWRLIDAETGRVVAEVDADDVRACIDKASSPDSAMGAGGEA